MPIKLIFAPAAAQSLDEIFDFIAADSPGAATRFVEALEDRLRKGLTTFPLMGAVYLGAVRSFVIEGYTFLYEYQEDRQEVHILDVFGRGENWR